MKISSRNKAIEIILDNQLMIANVEYENYHGELTSELVNRLINNFMEAVSIYEIDFASKSNHIDINSKDDNIVIEFSNTRSFGTLLRVEFKGGEYRNFRWV